MAAGRRALFLLELDDGQQQQQHGGDTLLLRRASQQREDKARGRVTAQQGQAQPMHVDEIGTETPQQHGQHMHVDDKGHLPQESQLPSRGPGPD
jgi:hypothetical protein